MSTEKERILIIRLGALGDLVFCLQAFSEIRQAHPTAEIALLTRAPFVEFAKLIPVFDKIIIDKHPTFTHPGLWRDLVKEIKAFAPTRIYDLQGKRRQTILYLLLGGPLGRDWSGAAPLCTFPRPWPPEPDWHFKDFLAAQLRAAGVPQAAPIDLEWLDAPIQKFSLPANYVALIPGCSANALHKRWPASHYAALASQLSARGLTCVTVGTKSDAEAISEIKKAVPTVIDLSSKTSLLELAGVFRHAVGVVGNDTGPLHLAASIGAPTLALFCGKSNPVWSRPPGDQVIVKQVTNLTELKVDDVLALFTSLTETVAPHDQ